MASCVEENFEMPSPLSGEDVLFSASVANRETKTIYGIDTTSTVNGVSVPAIKVNWVHGDEIAVYGASCVTGRQQANYSVNTINPNKPEAGAQVQNYAYSLDKVGDYGVQWGTTESDFYAIYPSDNVTFTKNGSEVVIGTEINSTQNNVFKPILGTQNDTIGWAGTHFANDAKNPSMQNAIMYARTNGATQYEEDGVTPAQVDLRFKPLTTVLKFRFVGYDYDANELDDPTVYVQSITITAPRDVAISGNFDLNITGSKSDSSADVTASTPSETGPTSNVITLNTMLDGGTFIPLKKDQIVEFDVFTIPVKNAKMGGKITRTPKLDENGEPMKDINDNPIYSDITCEYPWKVTINTQGHGTFEYTVIPSKDGTTFTLAPGQIHKIKIPKLSIDREFNWEPDKWITQIPKPVYISELSMPGAWNACDKLGDVTAEFLYQQGKTLTELYSAGVRAFHIDCRATEMPDGYGMSHQYQVGNSVYLAAAGTEDTFSIGIYKRLYDGIHVVDALKELAKLVATHPEEYIVVILSIAESPKKDGSNIFGTVEPNVVLPLINDAINNSDPITYDTNKTTTIKDIIYSNVDANTTVNDVLGKMIIKVNANTDKFTSASYNIPNSLISLGSMASNEAYITSNIVPGVFDRMLKTNMYFGKTLVTSKNVETQVTDTLKFFYHHAQRTISDNSTAVSGVPTYEQRKKAIDDIIEHSDSIYAIGTHNAWFQIGIGGSRKDANQNDQQASRDEVANTLNPYLNNLIQQKMNSVPSPVGIVLMNNCLSDSGQSLVRSIIEMNGKFYLNREGNTIITGGGTPGGSDTGAQTAEIKAYALVGENVF